LSGSSYASVRESELRRHLAHFQQWDMVFSRCGSQFWYVIFFWNFLSVFVLFFFFFLAFCFVCFSLLPSLSYSDWCCFFYCHKT
jgi:hypothetical protein